ncbi:hypothetical protein FN846DRAFT_906382 [Sphaerosporella brunnea]|uniref:Uncharacterized protein n=1 Tax=Sphaerosporella brunnea TaxID=1250544 RepID=A0A5J5EZ71_9PEZI|nr:hypothetical protein FN846DRAFT_906382 [Sphaerosporella brunnea]
MRSAVKNPCTGDSSTISLCWGSLPNTVQGESVRRPASPLDLRFVAIKLCGFLFTLWSVIGLLKDSGGRLPPHVVGQAQPLLFVAETSGSVARAPTAGANASCPEALEA